MAKKMTADEIKIAIETEKTTEVFNRISPNAIKFHLDYYICGNTYRCIWAINEFIYSTDNMALLADLSSTANVSLHLRHTPLTSSQENKVIATAERKNQQGLFSQKTNSAIEAHEDQKDLVALLAKKRKNKEPLIDVSIFLELKADTLDDLRILQEEIKAELNANKMGFDKLLCQQKEGFLAVIPGGSRTQSQRNMRTMPASSAANLFPFSYAGKFDDNGYRLGKDRYGGDIIVDFDYREKDKTNSHCIIAGNSGEGKSYLCKLICCNIAESGKRLIVIDPEGEYKELIESLGGTYIDPDGTHILNPLEPRDIETDETSAKNPQRSLLSRHISWLRDFFQSYKSSFTEPVLDALELMLAALYKDFGLSDDEPISSNGIYPTVSDLYAKIHKYWSEYEKLDLNSFPVTKEMLRDLLLAISSMAAGADSKYFNGQTNLPEAKILGFGFRELLESNKALLSVSLFNALSYMHNALMTCGNTVCVIDELHVFLTYPIAIKYIRSGIKRARKQDSYMILATQNIEDFLQQGFAEETKPLFTIPSHSFLFYPGNVARTEYQELTSVTNEEFALIRTPHRGSCLYRCGNERFLLQVEAPKHKAALFGAGGGR